MHGLEKSLMLRITAALFIVVQSPCAIYCIVYLLQYCVVQHYNEDVYLANIVQSRMVQHYVSNAALQNCLVQH